MSDAYIFLHHPSSVIRGQIQLPKSKSLFNRAIIIREIARLQNQKIKIIGESDADDVVNLRNALANKSASIAIGDAGTAMRFLTAYYAISGEQKILGGSARMHQRPIKILVDALLKLGAKIHYQGSVGFPPLRFAGFEQLTNKLQIAGDVSSQYISALLMAAPSLPDGLRLEIVGKCLSRPYIQMTVSMMRQCGAQVEVDWPYLAVSPSAYQPATLRVEPDWSSASYWYAMVALAKEAEVYLPDLQQDSLQGDRAIGQIMAYFGVATKYEAGGIRLSKQTADRRQHFAYDFTDCPDLAQTVAVVAAASGVEATLKGLDNLSIKETDRIQALEHELKKLNIRVLAREDALTICADRPMKETEEAIETYGDHRMAMAFACASLYLPMRIANPAVVRKSYPHFWEDLQTMGWTTKKALFRGGKG